MANLCRISNYIYFSLLDHVFHSSIGRLYYANPIRVDSTINISQSYIFLPLLSLTITFGTTWLLQYPLNAADCFAAAAFFILLPG